MNTWPRRVMAVGALVALATATPSLAETLGQPQQNISTGVWQVNESLELVTARVIDAPVKKVWAAWHDPEKMAKWWGPAGFHSTVKKLDVRPGGHFEIVMHGPDGTDYPNLYVFDHIEEFKQLIYTNAGSKEFDLAPFQSEFDLQSDGNKTRVVLTARFVSKEEKRKHVEDFHAAEGAQQLLQRLEEQSR